MSVKTLKIIDVSKFTDEELDTFLHDCRKEIEDRRQKTDDKLLAKFNEKYAGKWVKLKGLHTYDSENCGYRLVFITKITNVYHQDDAKAFNICAEYLKMYSIRDKRNVSMVECYVPPTKAWCDTHIEIHPCEKIKWVTEDEVSDKVRTVLSKLTAIS